MAATKNDVERWVSDGIKSGAMYVVSVCDTFDYDDYPVYCKDDKELAEAKLKYNGSNMQRINEVITLAHHMEKNMLKDLKSVLRAIRAKQIKVGIDKDYCFVTDEDGYLYLLKRPADVVIGQDMGEEYDNEPREQWPVNHYDGEEILKIYCGESRGMAVTEIFLEALGIDFL